MSRLASNSGCIMTERRSFKQVLLTQNAALAEKILLLSALLHIVEAQYTFEALYSTKVQPQSYTVQDGNYSSASISLNSSRDTSYNGSLENQTLSGGLGKLTDGRVATTTTVEGSGNVWMRWNTLSVQIIFFFKNPVSLCQIDFQLYGESLDSGVVEVQYGDGSLWSQSSIADAEFLNSSTIGVTSTVPKEPRFGKTITNHSTNEVHITISWNLLFTSTKPRLLALSEFSFFECKCPAGLHLVPCSSATAVSPCTDVHLHPSSPDICARYPDATCKNNFCQRKNSSYCTLAYVRNGKKVKSCLTSKPTPSQIKTTAPAPSSSRDYTGFVVAIVFLALFLLIVCVVILLRGKYYCRLKQKCPADDSAFDSSSTVFTDYSAQTISRIFMNKSLSDRDSTLPQGSIRTLSITSGSPDNSKSFTPNGGPNPMVTHGYDQPRTRESMYKDPPKQPSAFLALNKRQHGASHRYSPENGNTVQTSRQSSLSQQYIMSQSANIDKLDGGINNHFAQNGTTVPVDQQQPTTSQPANATSDDIYTPMNGQQSRMFEEDVRGHDMYTPMDGGPLVTMPPKDLTAVNTPMDGQPATESWKAAGDGGVYMAMNGHQPISLSPKDAAATDNDAHIAMSEQQLSAKLQNMMTSDV